MDENVKSAVVWVALGFLHLQFVLPLSIGMGVGPAPVFGLAGCVLSRAGQLFDPTEDRDRHGPQNQVQGVLQFLGTVLWLGVTKGHEELGDL